MMARSRAFARYFGSAARSDFFDFIVVESSLASRGRVATWAVPRAKIGRIHRIEFYHKSNGLEGAAVLCMGLFFKKTKMPLPPHACCQ